jgi:hypothetical protein
MNGRKARRRQQSAQQKKILWTVLGGILLVAAAAWMAFGAARKPNARATPEVTGAPRLKVLQERVDLGDVKLGRQVQVDIEVVNVGDQPLRLSEEPWIEVVEGC